MNMDVRQFVKGIYSKLDSIGSAAGGVVTADELLELMESSGMVTTVDSSGAVEPTPELREYLVSVKEFTGAVRFYAPAKDYGFIIPDDGGADVFVHRNAIKDFPVEKLVKGARVRFSAETSKRGLRVISLALI